MVSILLIFLCACSPIFETSADFQARKALQDLMNIQEAYHKEKNRYARNLAEIDKYNLKYHTGIVYLEIESAGKDKYRAIALPAESTTARVFAYDTDQGGFYEMDELEVSRYVLGALNHIRSEQAKQRRNDYFLFGLIAILLILGVRFMIRFGDKNHLPLFAAYFLSLASLIWPVSLLSHMAPDIVISRAILVTTASALTGAVFSLLIIGWWLGWKKRKETSPSLLGLLGTSIIIALLDGVVLVNIGLNYFFKT